MKKIPFEDALRTAEETAKRDDIVLYDGRTSHTLSFNNNERILWTPENWRVDIG